jgi:maltose O-acetyltransferase
MLPESHFCPLEGASLPRLNKAARLALKIHAVLPGGIPMPILRKLLKFPESISFQPGFFMMAGLLEFRGRASLGDTCFVDYAPVIIEDNVSFSFRNFVITSSHSLSDFKRVIAKPIIIERNVWITANVTILGGTTIGHNSVIGAGSVVTKSIPPGVLAAGNPCRPIRDI